jgi:hypothetical protein
MVARCPRGHQDLLNRPCRILANPTEIGPRRLPSRIHDLSRSTGLSKMRRIPQDPTPEAGVIDPERFITPAT